MNWVSMEFSLITCCTIILSKYKFFSALLWLCSMQRAGNTVNKLASVEEWVKKNSEWRSGGLGKLMLKRRSGS